MGEWQGDEMVTRQERREERIDKKRERMPQHGRALTRVYKDAVEKRVGQLREDKDKRRRIEGKKVG